jgi:hypothetical protein
MSHFYGSMEGSRGVATRCGTKGSGMQAYIRGWTTGVLVNLVHVDGKDRVVVQRTTGSSGSGAGREVIAEWAVDA